MTAATAVLAPGHHYPQHAAKHRRPKQRRPWPRRAGRALVRVAFWSTFTLGLIGWAAVIATVL